MGPWGNVLIACKQQIYNEFMIILWGWNEPYINIGTYQAEILLLSVIHWHLWALFHIYITNRHTVSNHQVTWTNTTRCWAPLLGFMKGGSPGELCQTYYYTSLHRCIAGIFFFFLATVTNSLLLSQGVFNICEYTEIILESSKNSLKVLKYINQEM